jgi:hypothetical protein
MKPDGGPAFPVAFPKELGLTLRDVFAALAMAGYCANHKTPGTSDEIAAWAYANADAMLAERLK